jgi:hypothetical protein
VSRLVLVSDAISWKEDGQLLQRRLSDRFVGCWSSHRSARLSNRLDTIALDYALIVSV